jgi:hypothetical protein
MSTPSNKSPEMANFLEKTFGRSTAIINNNCAACGGPAMYFRNPLSAKEYKISGLCQNCQDSVFGKD